MKGKVAMAIPAAGAGDEPWASRLLMHPGMLVWNPNSPQKLPCLPLIWEE